MMKNGDAAVPKGRGTSPKAPSGRGAYDVWVHREADALLSFPFGEAVAQVSYPYP